MTENILDEITHVIKALTGRYNLRINGSYDEDTNRLYAVQINAGNVKILDEDLAMFRELYGLRVSEVKDYRKYRPRGLERCIRYLMGISRLRMMNL